ncbi:right-handed parallel beta-helix repeat-containing protein [Nannocystis punicea]|uniref:Right-handed parallel beta-helix repeat-containing protein n=1 Tax=Nannocystis punicea TaxID=2995304 RepID=A0ABY7GWF1_9BACT|nr:right-handed parallel beta-helix repeat-containing protein [Nannocystis poenicansa]WAS91261.1 right-handed parallel beta-helix repeat-containing protein [Nannocystis poenicansa]
MRTSARNAIHRTTPRLTILAGLASILLSAAPASAKVTKIESCSTIDTAGIYLLTDDLSCEGDGIVITVGNVQLNGGHHRITSTTGTGAGIVLQGPLADVVIHNMFVQGFNTGMRIEDASHVSVMNTRVEDSAMDGIDVFGSVDVTFGPVAASGNGLNGIALFGSSGVLIRNGTYDLNGADGILVDEHSHDNVIHAVFARNNGYDGIEVDGDDNVLQANTAEENGAIGIDLAAGAIDNDLLANFALGNMIFDMADSNPTCVNSWKSARFETDNELDGRKSGCIQ